MATAWMTDTVLWAMSASGGNAYPRPARKTPIAAVKLFVGKAIARLVVIAIAIAVPKATSAIGANALILTQRKKKMNN